MITPNLFCPDPKFESQIVGVLNTHLFKNMLSSLQGTATSISCLHDIYEDMRQYCDCPDMDKKYMLDGQSVLPSFQKQRLMNNGYLYAGHDLPVWINTPNTCIVEKANCKIMIVGRDPGRKPYDMYEMTPSCDQLTIYSPFGLHCCYHRRKTQVIPSLVNRMLKCANECGETLSIYITDFYKFKKTDVLTIDTCNKLTYHTILMEEIKTFNPDCVILLGKQVMRSVGIPSSALYFNIFPKNGINYLPIPHPSQKNSNEIQKVKDSCNGRKMGTIEFLAKEVINILKKECCKKITK